MPYKDIETKRAYVREYNKKYKATHVAAPRSPEAKERMRIKRKAKRHRCLQELRILLGNKCVKCGCEENLHFDHIDPKTQKYRISTWAGKYPYEKILLEVKKCQLLCAPCHMKKTIDERGYNIARHGTAGMYSNHKCRCDLCRAVWNEACRVRKKNNRAKQKPLDYDALSKKEGFASINFKDSTT